MWRCTGVAKRSRTGRTRNGSSNGRRCARVLGAVARQHHHAERRAHEIRLGPDGEIAAPAEQLAGELVRGDEPAADRRHPRDRLEVAQAIERSDSAVLLEVGELDGRADREARPPRGILGLVDDDLGDEPFHAGDATSGR